MGYCEKHAHHYARTCIHCAAHKNVPVLDGDLIRAGVEVKYIGQDPSLKGLRGRVIEDRRLDIVVNFGPSRPRTVCLHQNLVVPNCRMVPPDTVEPLPKKPALPIDSAERKRWPMFSGLLRYFPAALANVSHHSFNGNEKHNPGQPLNHARGKSGDHEDCIVRHLVDASEHPAGSAQRIDELRALSWRALALLQEELELAGHRAAPAATFDKD
jgi:hypothetical protein